MKRDRITKVCLTICLILGMVLISPTQIKASAAEVIATVEGTVMSGTTSELLLLSTKEGKMEIKLDSGTDTSACKILLPDSKVYVSVSHESDGYLHAVKITSSAQTTTVSVDSSSSATVTGTIDKKSSGDVLYFNTPQGEMQIKLDATTDMSGCKVLVADKNYSIVCARGSDAYMHALSITDGTAASALSGITPAPTGTITAATTSVTGTVNSSTKENLLYLATSGGEMQIVIDNNTDSRNGMVLTQGRTLTVSVYRGSDAYMHAATITGLKESFVAANIDTSSVATVTGTVGSKSTENILFLDTPQGEMELKLDAVNSVSNCKVLVSGKKLTVTCSRGSDAYMHALTITGV